MRLTIRVLVLTAVVCVIAACSGGGAGGNATITAPPPRDTTKKVTPPSLTLDSLRRGVYDQNNTLHLYPDTMQVTLPHIGSIGSFSFSGLIAFTSTGPITDPASVQSLFGSFSVTSDNTAVIAPGGNCTGDGSPCLTLEGVTGQANITVTAGSKHLTTLIIVQ